MRIIGVVSVVLACLMMPLYAQDTLDSVEKVSIAQWDKIESMTGVFDLQAAIKIVPEQATPMNVVGSGNVQYAKSGDTPRYKGYATAGFTATTQILQAQALFDGKTGYYEAVAPMFGLSQAGQAGNDEIVPPGGKLLFSALRANFNNLTVCPAENVNGADCYVIQGTPKDPGDFPVAKLRLWIGKNNGVVCKVWATDATGTQSLVAALRELKVNAPVNDGVFKYTPLN